MTLYLQLFLLITFGLFHKGVAKNFCNDTFRELADAQSRFVNCAVRNSVTATSCIACHDLHEEMTSHYKNLVKNCSDKYISQNRLDMVYNMEISLDGLWNKGFCDDCFDNDNNTSDFTNKFNDLRTLFDNCLNENSKTPCINCTSEYIVLNDFFKNNEKSKKGKLCFDLQDAMNRTRSKWSKELKCCHRDFNLTVFLVGSTIFCAIPLMFYLGMYGYTKRLEQNHNLIDSTFGTESQQTGPSTSNTTSGGTSTREAPDINEGNEKIGQPGSDEIQNTADTDALQSTSAQSNENFITL